VVKLWQQEVVVELIDTLDAGEYLRNYVVGEKMLVVIAVQQLIVKHLHSLHHHH